MRWPPALAVTVLALGACHPTTPREQASADARDVAMVRRVQAQQGPVVPLAPEPVSFAYLTDAGRNVPFPKDVRKPRAGEGCGFVAAGAANPAPIFVAVPQAGLMKEGNRVEVFGADSGSATLASGLHTKYTSGAHALELTEGRPDPHARSWLVSLTLRDPSERIVYFSAGTLRCAG